MSDDARTDGVLLTDEGPWSVYDCYCLKCGKRFISVAPVQAENVNLWECPACGPNAATWHAYPDVSFDADEEATV